LDDLAQKRISLIMTKQPTAYHRPKNLPEALNLLAQPDTVPLAGGTMLLAGDVSSAVVDIQDLGINKIIVGKGSLKVGAATKLVELAGHLRENILADSQEDGNVDALLLKAIQQAGPNTYRNAATLGGLVASRLPDSELLAALLVLEAELVLNNPEQNTVSLAAYLAPEKRPAGLITEVVIYRGMGIGLSERVARTPADYPIVSVTGWQSSNLALKLAATGIDARPVRLAEAEAKLAAGLNDQVIADAADAARMQSIHPGDFRGDADYRANMAAVLTRRVLAIIPVKQ
jgi:CO/xanthine dehydrogenase FAD-binding subunit